MSRTLATALALCSLLASNALAQSYGGSERAIQVGVGGGLSVPVGDAKDALKNGFHVRGIVNVRPPGFPVALRGALGYQKFDLNHLPTGYDGTGSMLSGLAGLKLGFPVGPVQPYVTASLGAFRVESKVDSTGTEAKANETKFGIDAGAGLEFKLGSMSGFVEGRLENVYTDQGFDRSLLGNNSTRIIPVTFGLMF